MIAAISRAHLVRVWQQYGATGLADAASSLGFYYRAPQPVKPKPVPQKQSPVFAAPESPTPEVQHQFNETIIPPIGFWCAKEYQEIKKEETGVGDQPEWWATERPLTEEDERGKSDLPVPRAQPLVPWSRLWPFLFAALGRYCDSRRIHFKRALEYFYLARPIQRLPYWQRLTWAGQAQLLVDVRDTLQPFWDDLALLLRRITRFRGKTGLQVLVCEGLPEQGWRRWSAKKGLGPLKPYTLPAPGTPVLVLGDLGCLDAGGEASSSWLSLGKRLVFAGFEPVVLSPCPPRLWRAELTPYWRMVCWDRDFSLPRKPALIAKPTGVVDLGAQDPQKGVIQLMAMIAAAVRVEPALLRALRLLLPHGEADVGTEALVWQQDEIIRSPLACGFKPIKEVCHYYRGLFFDLPNELQLKVLQVIQSFHLSLPGSIGAEEESIKQVVEPTGDIKVTEGQRYWRRLLKKGVQEQGYFPGVVGQWADRVLERQHEAQYRATPELYGLWFLRNQEAIKQGQVAVPEGFDWQKVSYLVEPGETVNLALAQQGETFTNENGSPVLNIEVDKGRLVVGVKTEKEEQRYLYQLQPGTPVVFPVSGASQVWLETLAGRVEVESITKPEWAKAIGRDKVGLFVVIEDIEGERKVYWLPPGKYPVRFESNKSLPYTIKKGFWCEIKQYCAFLQKGFGKPKWANNIGMDTYGIYADFSIKNVSQRMRWIFPGEFIMGSPEDEKERSENETQHQVVLTDGFWLADTTCTQELWQIVMGYNPSHFKEPQIPVEYVSWKNCVNFMKRLNKIRPDIRLSFTTEAQWEYACRAGTITPFFFGENITTKQANYDSYKPYDYGKRGWYRTHIERVKAFSCNSWGLYQMHGNVLEWCADWYGPYTLRSILNPTGPKKGEHRVCRGGSWYNFDTLVRSAYRSGYTSKFRDFNLGLRFAIKYGD